jgi:hypothetical protein
MVQNTYTTYASNPGEAPGVTHSAFARPAFAAPTDNEIAGIEEGFSPALGDPSEGNMPDDIRTGKREPIFGGPHAQDINLVRGMDNINRRQDEFQISTGWTVKQSKPEIGVIPDQVQDIGPSRPSAAMGQNTYLFMRPWERPESTGEHFSMADHRRKYEIYGMAPRGGIGVNTYRLDPKPWDQNLHYNPVPTEPENGTKYVGGIAGNRSYRLG